MRDILPDATIRINIPAIQFFDEIAVVAAEVNTLQIDKHYQSVSISKMDILSFSPFENSPHEGLCGQFIYSEDDSQRIRVEARAHRWSDGYDITYQVYVEALYFLFRDLLRAYNKKHATRYRLTIQSKANCEPTLPPKAKDAFSHFTGLANKSGLHPYDWERFYRFSKICHAFHARVNEENVFRLLVHAGFSEIYARDLATVFGHLRIFQRM